MRVYMIMTFPVPLQQTTCREFLDHLGLHFRDVPFQEALGLLEVLRKT